MVLYNRDLVQAVENACFEKGITASRLMENAGSAVAKRIEERYPVSNCKILVLCGKGNNGGDGFVVARKLFQNGAKVVIALTDGEPTTEAACEAYDYANRLNIRMLDVSSDMVAFDSVVDAAELIVDAMFGIGFRGPLSKQNADIIDRINRSASPVVSVDVPSGVCADSACVAQTSIRATLTVTFFEKKICHVLYPSCAYCGETVLADIGIPDALYVPSSLGMIDVESCRRLLPTREPDSHKGTFGKVGVICGSYGMIGAAAMACEAAMKSGVGVVKMAASRSMYPILASKLSEPIFAVYPDAADGSLDGADAARMATDFSECDVLLIGCGLGRTENAQELTRVLLQAYRGPIVLDADSINAAASHIDILDEAKGRLILTPHIGEMARLCRVSVRALEENRLYYGRLIASRYDAVVVLKGASTLVFAPDGRTFFYTGGNDGMATAGSGDMLAGILAAFAAQTADLVDVARIGVAIHGMAGDFAAQRCSRRSMTTGDMLESLKDVYLSLE